MSDEIESFRDYWRTVQRTALIELEETEEYAADEGIAMSREELIGTVAEYAVEGSNLVMYNQRTIIYHCDNGFYDEGFHRFIEHRELEEPATIMRALAQAGLFNDVENALRSHFESKDALGQAARILEDTLWSEGVSFEYTFTNAMRNREHTFTLENCDPAGGDQWRVFDPNGDGFEVISPHVHLENKDSVNPMVDFKLWLDNICARRMHEIESE